MSASLPPSPSQAPPPPPGGRRHPLRFVWQMDEAGKFGLGSDEFLRLAGARTAAAIGRPWPELAAALDLDPGGLVARALASRDTWSGIEVAWPVDSSSERLCVELSGLPVFDGDRSFRGYRGFGVCRDLARLAALEQEPPGAPGAGEAGPVAASAPADPAASLAQRARSAENIVPFPAITAEPSPPRLSATERHAFGELSRKLAHRLLGIAPDESKKEPTAEAEQVGTPPAGAPFDARPILDRLPADDQGAEAEATEAGRRAQRLSSATWDLLAKISQEMQPPLSAIIGSCEAMMQEASGPVDHAGGRAALKDIHASSSDVLALLDVLRDLSKIEAGELALAFGGVAINEVVQQCIAVLQPQASRDRVIIRSSLATALPVVIADPASVRQLLLQLLSGSIKLAGAGGQVIVSSAVAESGDVVLRVRHKAIGTNHQQTASASEPVEQAAASPREEPRGMSLRLLLSKALAEANRASFRLERTREGTLVELAFSPMRIGPAGGRPAP